VKRAIFKTITYRIFGSISTFAITYLFTGEMRISAIVGVSELLWKPILYLAHELVWEKLPEKG
jgi:uncharacterized membrane protein